MSLATAGGGAGAGMAGGGPGAMAMAHQAHGQMQSGAPPPPDAGDYADAGHGTSMPSAGVLGADLMDKQHGLSLKYVKNSSEYPIVALDLFSSDPVVAYYPRKPDDPSLPVSPILVGKMKAKIALKATEPSHKTFRKYLNHSKSYSHFKADCLSKIGDKDAVVIEEPHHWLGMRRLEEAPSFLAEAASSQHVVNGSLEGPDPLNNDNDRVVYKITLNASKKPVTVLPEEAVELLLHQAQHHVHTKLVVGQKDESASQHSDDAVLQYPVAIAVPAWAAHDSSVEAVLDATGSGGVFFQRSICALAGALQPPPGDGGGGGGPKNALLDRLGKVRAHLAKEYQRLSAKDPDYAYHDDLTLVLLGMTSDGFEATAVQVSGVQNDLDTCLFGNFKVLSNVSYMSSDPLSQMRRCTEELEAAVQDAAPESDGPCAMVVYGTPAEQEKIAKQWKELASSSEEWKDVPVLTTKSDCIALGTAVLGAVTHGRQIVLVPKGDGNSNKLRAELGIRVQNVAPAAVAYRLNYHGTDESTWTPPKTIFDFDRRIPAGPYPIDFSAAECVVHRDHRDKNEKALSDDDFVKATKDMQGNKHIPRREEAALALRVEILQRWTRDGKWIKVGETMEPLVKLDEEELDADGEAKKIACESVTLEISLGVHGMLTSSMVGERESVVQAVQSARTNAFRFYLGIALAVLFFGGFLFKSYWEEYVLNRDTAKLLAYYRHVVPGSISDGDHRSAMHVVYRYRHNKAALWKKIETKYGVPMRGAHEWEGYVDEKGEDEPRTLHDEGEVDLDSDGDDGTGEDGDRSQEDEL